MRASKTIYKSKKVLAGAKTEYRAWKEWAEGDWIVGKLVGTSPNRKNKSKKDWILEVEEVGFEDAKAAKKLKKGTKITLNCAGQLDRGMEQVGDGELVQVVYNGEGEMEGGDYAGQMAHSMEVTIVEPDSDEDEDSDEEEEDDDL